MSTLSPGLSGPRKESERRQATIMFADISGFTAMSETIDAEDVTTIMNDCFEMMGSIVQRFGGHIDKFIGDCVMAVFGVPAAIENAPEKAVACALEMRDQLSQFNKEKDLPIPLDIHIGINSGMVIAGQVGSTGKKDYTVMGDAVNLASRLEDLSAKGQILAGPETYRYTRNNFTYQERKPTTIKGKAEPVAVYELVAAVNRHRSLETATDSCILSSALVGRKKELDRLELSLLEVINGKGSIINIIGEAGIGKSRLIAEFIEKCAGRDVFVLEGKSRSMGKHLSFHPIIHLLKGWFRITDEEDSAASLKKLKQELKRMVPDKAEDIGAFIATVMGLHLPDEMAAKVDGIEGDKLARVIALSMKDLIAAVAEKRPVVLVFEDAHWSDISSIDLLTSCFRLVPETPALFINVFRPIQSDSCTRLQEFLEEHLSDYSNDLRLQALDPQCTIELVEHMLNIDTLPPKIQTEITERTGGNPFFTEEVVRSMVDSGKIHIRNGACELVDDLDLDSVPSTIEEVIMARLDMLDEEKRELLKIASVIGRTFFYSVLNQVAVQIRDMDIHLQYLKGTQIIRERRRMEEVEYIFKHALAQEAVYNSILLKTKRALHVSVARAIEQLFNQRLHDFYGMLAYHYSLGEDVDHAEEYLRKAGEQALQTSASTEALHFLTNALQLYRKKFGDKVEPMRIAELEWSIGKAYQNKGYYADAVDHFRVALTHLGVDSKLPGKTGELWVLLRAAATIVRFLARNHPVPGKDVTDKEKLTYEILYQFMTVNGMVNSKESAITGYVFLHEFLSVDHRKLSSVSDILSSTPLQLAFVGMVSGVSLGRRLLKISPLYFATDDHLLRFRYEFSHIAFALATGDKPLAYNEELVAYNLRYGDSQAVNCYLLWHGLLGIEQGDFDAVERIVTFSNGIVTDYQNEEARLHSAMLNGRYFIKTGKVEDAADELEDAVSLGEITGLKMLWAWSLGITLQAESLLGDMDKAARTLSKIEEFQSSEPLIYTFVRSALAVGMLSYYIALRRAETGVSTSGNAPEHARPGEMSGHNNTALQRTMKKHIRNSAVAAKTWAQDRTEIYKLIGLLCQTLGNYKQAGWWWNKAIEAGTQLGATLEVEKTKALQNNQSPK